jgi:hypothetical protein
MQIFMTVSKARAKKFQQETAPVHASCLKPRVIAAVAV